MKTQTSDGSIQLPTADVYKSPFELLVLTNNRPRVRRKPRYALSLQLIFMMGCSWTTANMPPISHPTPPPRSALLCAIVHSGPSPASGAFFRCARAQIVADQVLVWLTNLTGPSQDEPLFAEIVAGALPVVGSVMRCARCRGMYFELRATSEVPRGHWLYRLSSEDRTQVLLHTFGAS